MSSVIQQILQKRGLTLNRVVADFSLAYTREEPTTNMPDAWLPEQQHTFTYKDFKEAGSAIESLLRVNAQNFLEKIISYRGNTPLEISLRDFNEEEFLRGTKTQHLFLEAEITNHLEQEPIPKGYMLSTTFDREKPRIIQLQGEGVPITLLKKIDEQIKIYQPDHTIIVPDYQQ